MIQSWRRVFPTCRLHIFEKEPVGYGKKPFLQMQVRHADNHAAGFDLDAGMGQEPAVVALPADVLDERRL